MSQVPAPPAGVGPVAPGVSPVAAGPGPFNAGPGMPVAAAVGPVAPGVPGPVNPVAGLDNTGPTAPAINGPVAPPATEGEAVPKPRAKRKARAAFRADDAPKLTSAEPQGYSTKDHIPLGKADFVDEATFYDFKALQAKKQVAKYEELAKEARTEGGAEQRKAKKSTSKALELLSNARKVLGEDAYAQLVKQMQEQMQQKNAAEAAAAQAGL
jgi:hypothetical protein